MKSFEKYDWEGFNNHALQLMLEAAQKVGHLARLFYRPPYEYPKRDQYPIFAIVWEDD